MVAVKTFGRAMINLGSMQIFVRMRLARVYFISATGETDGNADEPAIYIVRKTIYNTF